MYVPFWSLASIASPNVRWKSRAVAASCYECQMAQEMLPGLDLRIWSRFSEPYFSNQCSSEDASMQTSSGQTMKTGSMT